MERGKRTASGVAITGTDTSSSASANRPLIFSSQLLLSSSFNHTTLVGWLHVRVRSESSAWVPCSCGSESSWIVLLGAIWDGRGSCVGLWTGSWIRCRFHIRVRVHVHVRGLVRFRIHCHGNGNGIGRGCCEDRRLCCGGGSLIRRIAGAAAGGSGYL